MIRGDEDIEGGLRKLSDTRKGGSKKSRGGYENLNTSKPTGGGEGSYKIEPLARGAAKISSLSFNIFISPPPTPPPHFVTGRGSVTLLIPAQWIIPPRTLQLSREQSFELIVS